jgi:putative ABC transport system substrate-binding protein
MTGVYQFATGLEAKRLGLLHEMVPKATTIAVPVNPNFSPAETQLRDVRDQSEHREGARHGSAADPVSPRR